MNLFRIDEGIFAYDLALIIGKTLIISDIHLGYENVMHKQGYFLPKTQLKLTVQRFRKIERALNFNSIIINGDLKHNFSYINDKDKKDIIGFLAMLKRKYKLIVIEGNHDAALKPVLDSLSITIVKKHIISDILIIHGDKVINIPRTIKKIIIGHEHPAISITDGVKHETYKCYLKGTFRKRTLIVQPSFNVLNEGSNVIRDKILSPYITEVLDFDVYVIGKEIYDFGNVFTVRNMGRI
jgi:putative SbcD/Mre11-related phosphoesterase